MVRAFLLTYLREDQEILPHRDGDHYCKQHIEQPGAAPLLGPHVQQEDGVAGEGGHQQTSCHQEHNVAANNTGVVARHIHEIGGEQ